MKGKGFIFLVILLLFMSFGAEAAITVNIHKFDTLDGLSLTGENLSPDASMELDSDPENPDRTVLKLNYAFLSNGVSFPGVLISEPKLEYGFGTFGMWVYSEGTGNPFRIRLVDRTREIFQHTIKTNLDWVGWQYVEWPLETYSSSWGGNGNGQLDLPLEIILLVDRGSGAVGSVYFKDLTLTVEQGTAKGQVRNMLGQPVPEARVVLKQDGNVVAETNASEDGSYSITAPPGEYTIEFTRAGYEAYSQTIILEDGDELAINPELVIVPDLGVWSDHVLGIDEGLVPVKGTQEGWDGETAFVGGREAIYINSDDTPRIYYLPFDISDYYIYDGSNTVLIYVEYFDLGTGRFSVQYESQTSRYTTAGVVTRTNTGQWKTAVFHITDGKFTNRCSSGDFRLCTYVEGQGGRQPGLYVGKVTVRRPGQILSLTAEPSVISPALEQSTTITYWLSAPARVSAWAEDSQGRVVKTFLDGREEEELTSSFTWGGLKEDLSPVPDGVYSIKLKAEGQSWDNTPVMIVQVTVTSTAPEAPEIVYPTAETGLVVNENLVALKIKGTPGGQGRIYLDDEPFDSVFLDASGERSYTLQLPVGSAQESFRITATQLDLAGNESAKSKEVVITYDPNAPVGQIRVSSEVLAPPGPLTISFNLTQAGDVELLLLSRTGAELGVIETYQGQVPGLITLDWDGTIAGQEVADGSYLLAVKLDGALQGARAMVKVDAKAPKAPVLLLPGENGQVTDARVRFVWDGARDVISYRLKVWQEDPEEPCINEEVYSTSYQLSSLLASGVWYWQVVANKANGKSSESQVSTFTVFADPTTVLEVRHLAGGPNPLVPDGDGRYEQLQISYHLTQPATVKIVIFNLAGRVVYETPPVQTGAGMQYFAWDGRDKNGKLVPKGAYLLMVRAENPQNNGPAVARKLISVLY